MLSMASATKGAALNTGSTTETKGAEPDFLMWLLMAFCYEWRHPISLQAALQCFRLGKNTEGFRAPAPAGP